jgi:peptidoglycan/xylan/chitin deacetylase (PgdA/CDA1 family)
MTRPLASVSLDLDDQWSYMKTQGNAAWETLPTYLDVAIPRILRFLAERQLTITFFIVGRDAAMPRNHALMRSLRDAGHEIASHSFNHDPWLHLYTEAQLNEELAAAEQAIAEATGVHPVGFRGPGFSLSGKTLRVLARRGYRYDATVFPNVLNPLARAYFLARSQLSAEERKRREGLFGSWREALKPSRPFVWEAADRPLLEIPVTTMPLFKVPIHMSYVLYASGFSRLAARLYIGTALRLCAGTGLPPSMLLHPLDFLGREDGIDALSFFPGMDLPLAQKLEVVGETLGAMAVRWRLGTMAEHADALLAAGRLQSRLLPA